MCTLQVATIDIVGNDDADDESSIFNNADDQQNNGDDIEPKTSKISESFRRRRLPSSGDENGDGSGEDDASSPENWDGGVQKTFGHNTLETLPHADHYRNILSASGHCRLDGRRQRPTLMELHEQDIQVRMGWMYT